MSKKLTSKSPTSRRRLTISAIVAVVALWVAEQLLSLAADAYGGATLRIVAEAVTIAFPVLLGIAVASLFWVAWYERVTFSNLAIALYRKWMSQRLLPRLTALDRSALQQISKHKSPVAEGKLEKLVSLRLVEINSNGDPTITRRGAAILARIETYNLLGNPSAGNVH